MVELDIECEPSYGQKQEGKVGVHQRIEDGFLHRHVENHNWLADEIKRRGFTVEALEGFPLHLVEEIFGRGRDVVDHIPAQAFLPLQRLPLPPSPPPPSSI